jgi:4-amino-4-deoxy-L-arabinose transferase-like glycosyltransferase
MIKEKYYPWLIALLGLVFFVPFLGSVHLFDWDEINFAESAREMIVSGDYSRVQVGFRPFWEKPPLFFWLQSISMHIFGVNEFAARLPNALFGSLTLVTIYLIGKRLRSVKFGLLWVLLYFGSILPHLYFKSGIIDPVFNYFIFTAIYFLMLALQSNERKMQHSIIAGLLIGLAVLTKGPVGFLLLLLTFIVILILQRFKNLPNFKQILVFALSAIFVSLFWYGFEMIENGPWFLVEFLNYQVELFSSPVADHAQPFYYHFVVVLLGCFPMSVLALGGFKLQKASDPMAQWMMVLFWVVMILFTIVTTKIVHYSSMAYLPLSFIAADYLYPRIQASKGLPKWVLVLFVLVGSVFGVLLTALPLINVFRDRLVPLINDPFAVAGIMKEVHWGGNEYLIGIFYFVLVMYAGYWIAREKVLKGIVIMGINTGLTLFLYMIFVLPKVEAHTQGSLIDFLEEVKGEDVYVVTHGFHSYAPFFYFEQPNDHLAVRANKDVLISGEVAKPVYIISKITDTYLPTLEGLTLLKEEGGYRFYLRKIAE